MRDEVRDEIITLYYNNIIFCLNVLACFHIMRNEVRDQIKGETR